MRDRSPGPATRRLSVWLTGQRDHVTQLHDSGYVPGTEADTDRVPPAIAGHAITAYTHPGELVLDPDCGTGTVLTEALRAGRHTLGLTSDARWWAIARANVTAARRDGACHDGSVLDAEPKTLATARAAGLVGRVGLVLTALRTTTADPAGPERDLDSAFNNVATTLNHCEPLLRPGGHLIVIARPVRHPDGSLADVTTRLITAGVTARLIAVDRCVALTAELRGNRLITRATFAERRAARSCATGTPFALTAHHEVLVFQRAADTELVSAATHRQTSPMQTTRHNLSGLEDQARRRVA
ncbi:DNA methyltransferase [Saccharothrix sp. NRRL B-16314]|uniref:DNA methyltransferase n=1 Tax=Saccharothrix sp. NRRL B-16314 TaxID=1463825 RepID=UPI000AEEC233|nr:DNA methyltransferase [Saccharothrix sp. NRRL B-16314]